MSLILYFIVLVFIFEDEKIDFLRKVIKVMILFIMIFNKIMKIIINI